MVFGKCRIEEKCFFFLNAKPEEYANSFRGWMYFLNKNAMEGEGPKFLKFVVHCPNLCFTKLYLTH